MNRRISKKNLKDAKILLSQIPPAEGEKRTVEKCNDCGHLFGRRFIPFGIGIGATYNPCLCQVTGHRSSITVLVA